MYFPSGSKRSQLTVTAQWVDGCQVLRFSYLSAHEVCKPCQIWDWKGGKKIAHLWSFSLSPCPHNLDLRQLGPGEVEKQVPEFKIQSVFLGYVPTCCQSSNCSHPAKPEDWCTKLQSFSSGRVRCHWQGWLKGLSWTLPPREVSQDIPCSHWSSEAEWTSDQLKGFIFSWKKESTRRRALLFPWECSDSTFDSTRLTGGWGSSPVSPLPTSIELMNLLFENWNLPCLTLEILKAILTDTPLQSERENSNSIERSLLCLGEI